MSRCSNVEKVIAEKEGMDQGWHERCEECGRFISLREVEHQIVARCYTPDTTYTIESMTWACARCVRKEKLRKEHDSTL
jgi:uncharacterized paraquat-inducible protein A